MALHPSLAELEAIEAEGAHAFDGDRSMDGDDRDDCGMEIAMLSADQAYEDGVGFETEARTTGLDDADYDGALASDREDALRMELHLMGYGDDMIDDMEW